MLSNQRPLPRLPPRPLGEEGLGKWGALGAKEGGEPPKSKPYVHPSPALHGPWLSVNPSVTAQGQEIQKELFKGVSEGSSPGQDRASSNAVQQPPLISV